MYTLSIVIVNWNSGNQLIECLKSIRKAKKSNFYLKKIIVVDNASTDHSLDNVEKINLPIEIIKNPENYGFAKACNIGAKHAEGDFILFLNPDMIVFEDTFVNLFNYIYKHDRPEIGIYGIQLLDDDGNIQKTCARFPNLWNLIVRTVGLDKINPKIFKSYRMEDWSHKETKKIDHVIGAFFLVKRHLFEKLNGFDEKFFVYIEDLDFSKRAHNLGYKTVYITEAKAYHKGGGTSEKVKGKRLFYNAQSRVIYVFKHFGFVKGLILMGFIYFVEPISRISFLTLKRNFNEIPELLKGYLYLYKNTLKIIKTDKK
ncbi:hypothetical protein SAMN06265182_0584 [Persephonella hydrogeniphila]|uniref:Glycosyltransferase 2-like domain-containing protein n=1 Tax=Persephonella hydrogeniphila TaxID=198703 RepID=A0A285NE13_9AQUI|nr:glycosyltransferase family 2 protein [Persephonella hydrogeniphila]SNZ06166.1 hypothetical protein SAMN06265182_0584 [Persephonella hydrogeniphila]